MTTSNYGNNITPNYSITGTNVGIGTGSTYNYTTTTVPTNWSFNTTSSPPLLTVSNGSTDLVLNENASLCVKGKVIINGQDLEERLKVIEDLLMIPERDIELELKYPNLKKKFNEVLMNPERDVILENKYPELKKMYKDYKRTLDKYRNWETLKESK